MSYAPFDGVLLADTTPAIAGAFALLLHLRVARGLARERGWPAVSLDAVHSRAQACQELLEHGLLPGQVRGLGLAFGEAGKPHSLTSLLAHFERYLAEVARAGFLEPDHALWLAVDRHLGGDGRGFWIERSGADGLLLAGLRDLAPARLRVLACIPELAGALFPLATRKGGEGAGLFGSSLSLTDWFLEGLEAHGQGFPNEIMLAEPEGWGAAPWSRALDGLFEGPLELGEHREVLVRGLAEGPMDLLRHGVEQVCAWLDLGIPPADITVIHPEPYRVAALLEPVLAQEGIALHVRGGLLPLLDSAAWSPVWMVLGGLLQLDPCTFSAGLRASRHHAMRQWAEVLAAADQDGETAFQGSFMHLRGSMKDRAQEVWGNLSGWRESRVAASEWAVRIETLMGMLGLPADPDDFFAPMGLLKDAWGREAWSCEEMLLGLRAFLETARSAKVPRSPEGLRLVAPGTLLDDWSGSRATLVLDVSEGAWPAPRPMNPDLDWNRKAAINAALLEAARADQDAVFSPALQRFRLPRSEHGDQVPRAFQQEAYAFNKVLAMTRERLTVLSPAQDLEGRAKAQGPFWNALEGAGEARLDPGRNASRLRWQWEGHALDERAESRAAVTQVRPLEEALKLAGPGFDRLDQARALWLQGKDYCSPTALEVMARCPFRSMAERIWGLRSTDAAGQLVMAVGTLAHHVLETALTPFVGAEGWAPALLASAGMAPGDDPAPLNAHLRALWEAHREDWLGQLREVPPEQWPQAALDLEELLPNLAGYLVAEAAETKPDNRELAFLFPELLPWENVRKSKGMPLQDGWTRILVSLEEKIEPVPLELEGGRTLLVSGKLDRLELWRHDEGREFLRVTDYKTSRLGSLRAYAEAGAPFAGHLQTPLYMLLVEEHYKHQATSALVPLRGDEHKPFTGHLATLAAEGGEEGWRTRLKRNLARFDARLDSGDFPPTPGSHCQYCELSALCGRPVDLVGEADEED